MKLEIRLDTVEKVKEFVTAVSKLDGDFDLVADKHYIVDAKSIMGIFSLDLSRTLTLTSKNADESVVRTALAKFIV